MLTSNACSWIWEIRPGYGRKARQLYTVLRVFFEGIRRTDVCTSRIAFLQSHSTYTFRIYVRLPLVKKECSCEERLTGEERLLLNGQHFQEVVLGSGLVIWVKYIRILAYMSVFAK